MYPIAIPSHRRPDYLEASTLHYLFSAGANARNIFIFLSDDEDMDLYSDIKSEHPEINLINTKSSSLRDKLKYIRRWFQPGTDVFFIEDDITAIVRKVSKQKTTPHLDVQEFIGEGFSYMKRCRSKIWGISPHANAFYMADVNTFNFKFIVAFAYGFVAGDDPFMDITQHGKSDYERSILAFLRYGSTPRLNQFGAMTRGSYARPGGLQSELGGEEVRFRHERESVDYLTHRYKIFCYENKKKPSSMPEIKLRSFKVKTVSEVQSMQSIVDLRLGYRKRLSSGK